MPVADALEDVGDAAKTLAAGEGSPIGAAAQVAAVSLQKRPDAEALAIWLADAELAHRLKWPAPVPLIAGQIRRGDLRAAARPDADGAWQTSWALAYARDAARRVEILLTEDVQAATETPAPQTGAAAGCLSVWWQSGRALL